jgi:RimJ/RimL family protein N-acetyltransferase
MKFVKVYTKPLINRTASIARKIWLEHYEQIIGRNQVEYMLEKFQSSSAIEQQIQKGWHYYLLCDGFRWVGYIAIVPEPDSKTMLLSKYYIDRRYRGMGYGKESMDFIKHLCRRMNYKNIWLTVNKHNAISIKIYEKIGFTKETELKTDIGDGFYMDDFKMSMPIKEK